MRSPRFRSGYKPRKQERSVTPQDKLALVHGPRQALFDKHWLGCVIKTVLVRQSSLLLRGTYVRYDSIR